MNTLQKRIIDNLKWTTFILLTIICSFSYLTSQMRRNHFRNLQRISWRRQTTSMKLDEYYRNETFHLFSPIYILSLSHLFHNQIWYFHSGRFVDIIYSDDSRQDTVDTWRLMFLLLRLAIVTGTYFEITRIHSWNQ